MSDEVGPVEAVATPYPPNIIRIEHYQEEDAQAPTAWMRFEGRWARFKAEREVARWASVVTDSLTSKDLSARKYHQYVLNPDTKHPIQWYGGAKDLLEESDYIAFGALRCDVALCAHIDEEKDEVSGEFVRNPAAPGKLSKRLPAGYAEMYRTFARRVGADRREYVIQTANDGKYNASTQLDGLLGEIVIPKGTGWADVITMGSNGVEPGPQHVILVGDSGTGKSTFASYGRLPMLVFMWDPVGKDTPYRKRGVVIDSFDEEAAWDASGNAIAWTHVEVVEVKG